MKNFTDLFIYRKNFRRAVDVSNEVEKTNPRNGLCLNALHDKAFEKGFITVKPNYEKIYLRADFEAEENLRIEMFYLELNTSLKFLNAEQEDRKNYCGKIYFVEYESNEIAEQNILTDFLKLAGDGAIFLLYEDDDLKKFLEIYPNKYIFLRI